MSEILNVLLIDDSKQDADAIRLAAANESITIRHFLVWNQAREELEGNFHAYDGVIADYRGQIEQDDTTDDHRHLSTLVRELEIMKVKGNFIPYVVHTGFKKEAEKYNKLECPVFSKSNHETMLRGLRELIETTPRSKLKHAYPTVFKFAHEYFSSNDIELLYNVVEKIASGETLIGVNSFEAKKSFMDKLRNLNEALIDTVLVHYPHKHTINSYLEKIREDKESFPEKYQELRNASTGNRSATFAEYFSIQTGRLPDHIKYTFQSIYYTASKYTSHSNSNESRFLTKEMIRGLVYCHLGCYEWFNELIQNKKR